MWHRAGVAWDVNNWDYQNSESIEKGLKEFLVSKMVISEEEE